MRDRHIPTLIGWVASVLWMGVIFAFSAIPGGSMPAGNYGGIGHFSGYLVLGALYFVALSKGRTGWQAVALAVALASLYGVTDEFHQYFVPGRVPDPMDWAVDTAGALTGALVALVATRRLNPDEASSDGETGPHATQ